MIGGAGFGLTCFFCGEGREGTGLGLVLGGLKFEVGSLL
jgi:hypothetical protein